MIRGERDKFRVWVTRHILTRIIRSMQSSSRSPGCTCSRALLTCGTFFVVARTTAATGEQAKRGGVWGFGGDTSTSTTNKFVCRTAQGGGTGAPFIFRVYVESGFVLLLCLGFSVISPLVTPICLLNFLISVPLFRRQLILVHRPIFDTGGR